MKEIKVKSCGECPFFDSFWWACCHEDGPKKYLDEDSTIHPDCPLRQQAVVVSIDEPQQPTTCPDTQ